MLPAPANNPLEAELDWTHGFPWENVDLARVALHELLERDAAGNLSSKQRHQIDEIAISNLHSPLAGPVQYYLNDELVRQLSEGKLTPEESERVWGRAIAMRVSAQPVVVQGDPVVVWIDPTCRLPRGPRRELYGELTYPLVRVDGAAVHWSKVPRPQPELDAFADRTKPIRRLLLYSTPGRHRIDLGVKIDIRESPSGTIVRTEWRSFSTYFDQIDPPLGTRILRLLRDPQHEIGQYMSLAWLRRLVRGGPLPLRDMAVAELIRRDRAGELCAAQVALLADELLAIQGDRTQPWRGRFGDYLESLHAAHRLADAKWQLYGRQQLSFYLRARSEIGQGEPLPIEMVSVARRGNSEAAPFPASQWVLEETVLDGVAQSLQVSNRSDVIVVPHGGDESAAGLFVLLPGAAAGKHSIRARLNFTPYSNSPEHTGIPTKFDLGWVGFRILPRGAVHVRGMNEPGLKQQVAKCVTISEPIRWEDGNLSTSIELHRPPVDLAFRISLEAGGRTWELGEIFCAKGRDSNGVYGGFTLVDARTVPTHGLVFHFLPDPAVAGQTVDLHEYWNGHLSVGPMSVGTDRYQGSKH